MSELIQRLREAGRHAGHHSALLNAAAAEIEYLTTWQPIETVDLTVDKNGYGKPVLLRLSGFWAGEVAHARWFAPWLVWHRVGEEALLDEVDDCEMFGIGSGIPDGWMPEPKP